MKRQLAIRTLIRPPALVAAVAAACAVTGLMLPGVASASSPAKPSTHAVSVVLSGSPGVPAANTRTQTVYVPIQCTNSSCSTPRHVVDVINAATCNARVRSDCRVVARARVGTSPLAAVVDQKTDTVYVVNGSSNTVSVLNGARCNARVTVGCRRPVATVKVGQFPVAAAFDPKTKTLYVASPQGHIFVINAADCNALTTSGCRRPVKSVRDSRGPQSVDVDVATDTVYTADDGTGNGDTVSVINGAACNGHVSRGCGRAPRSITVGSGAFWDVVDQATDTVYVANNNDGTVSVINGARCNARKTAGCGRTPPAITTGAGPAFVAVDDAVHTVFAINQGDDTMSAISTRTCSGRVTSGCRKVPRSLQAGPDHAPGYDPFPGAAALIPQTGSAYVLTVGGASVLSVTSISRCNASRTSGCRRPAPAVADHEFVLSADPATDTIYAGDLIKPQIDVINGATCHARQLAGCALVAEIPMPDSGANVGAINDATHTLYASDEAASGTVAVINTATCNAGHTTGCAASHPAIAVGAFPGPPALNASTQTLYVPAGAAGNEVAVANVAACSAVSTSGCGQSPAEVNVGDGTNAVAVSNATNTVYAPNSGSANFNGDTMAVINGATCNGTDHSGCGHLAATVKVGFGPVGVAVDDHTHTVYVANNADGDSPGTVSVINAATCNGTDTTGCRRHFPVMATGVSPLLIALDVHTGVLYVSDFASAEVSILTGSRCNASVTSGCKAAPREQQVGSQPVGLAVDPLTRTVYVADTFQDGSMSVFPASR